MNAGRPLRFLAMMLAGWSGVRAIAIYREGRVEAPPWIAPIAQAVAAFVAPPAVAKAAPATIPTARKMTSITAPVAQTRRTAYLVTADVNRFVASSPSNDSPPGAQPPRAADVPRLAPAVEPPPIAHGPSRLAGSAWLIARGGMAASVTGGQLGGSQAGARLTYALGSARKVAVSARVSAPLAGTGREAAVGIDWQPTHAPVHVIAEQRFSIDGGRGGTVVGVIGGFGPVPILHRLTLEGYGQAGMIARDGIEGFGDGAVRAAHPLADIGRVRVDIGAGAWGGAQRGASRLDIGPSIGIVLPIGPRSLRLMADWRQRVAGSARPGSGPALSLGTNL